MKEKRLVDANHFMHMAQNAFARCAEKVNTRKNLTLNRQAVGEVVSYCTMIAANDTLDFDRDKQERLCTEMNHRARGIHG